jgi:hypothetical protein
MKVLRCRDCKVPVWDCATKMPVEGERLEYGKQYTTEHVRGCPQHPDIESDDDGVYLVFA